MDYVCMALAAAAAGAIGLWWGERGRRLDAQRREERVPLLPVPPAKVVPPGGLTAGERAEGGVVGELADPPERFIADIMAEAGVSEDEAREEWNRMIGQVMGDRSGA